MSQSYLLPIVDLKFERGGKSTFVRCLLDDGSQRSYISQDIMDDINCDTSQWESINFNVHTFLGTSMKSFKECSINILIPGFRDLPLPVLIDDLFKTNLLTDELAVAFSNIREKGYKLACLSLDQTKNITVKDLIGVDILQFFSKP